MTDPARTLILEIVGDRISPSDVDALAAAIAQVAAEERRQCVKLCRDRVELWRNSSLGEAQARANEAQYLADAIEMR